MDEKRAASREDRLQGRKVFVGNRSQVVNRLLGQLPPLEGAPVALEWGARLRISKGVLHRGPGPGTEVHAAAFPRKRLLVLEAALRRDPRELARIAVHELFHFVWVRLSNRHRSEWSRLLAAQTGRGELGWSSEWRKDALLASEYGKPGRRWSEYVCESFCDTAAWLYSGATEHEEFTLGRTERAVRRGWFQALLRHRAGVFRI